MTELVLELYAPLRYEWLEMPRLCRADSGIVAGVFGTVGPFAEGDIGASLAELHARAEMLGEGGKRRLSCTLDTLTLWRPPPFVPSIERLRLRGKEGVGVQLGLAELRNG